MKTFFFSDFLIAFFYSQNKQTKKKQKSQTLYDFITSDISCGMYSI